MVYIDPITKKYYDIFTKGKYAEKLEEVKNFYGVYRHIMDDIVPVTNAYGGTVIATLVNAIVGQDDKGYGLLNVVCWADNHPEYPLATMTDLAWIENGVVHTWFPYQKLAYFKSDGTLGTVRFEKENMNNYETKEKALSFIRKTSVDEELHHAISKGIINGYYEDVDLAEMLECIKDESVDCEEKTDETEMSYADMLDDFGMEAKEPMEELEEIHQSEMKMLLENDAKADDKTPLIDMSIPEDEILEGDFVEIVVSDAEEIESDEE